MNHIVLSTLISLIIAQGIKFLIGTIKAGKADYRLIYSNGSMPSSHSSILSTLIVMVGHFEGIDSIIWGITLVFSLLIIGDAMGIRTQSGKQAKVLNQLVGEKRLREQVGHKPTEVIGGIILGIIVALLYITLIIK
ncbi:MAG TPA: divergent PAP2 family protein [Acholeplasmataceae bacterium]|nr:divergent PAP2 family protein [Acholeplasmataceae bacterium]